MAGPDGGGRSDHGGAGVEWSFGADGDGGWRGRGASPLPGDGGDPGDRDAERGAADGDAPSRAQRIATWLAGGLLAVLALLVAARALHNERTHRRIQRDIQHVVALEADAQRTHDREIYFGLQHESRRRLLRRPDLAAAEAYALGPYPGLYFARGAPRVTAVEVAAKTPAGVVSAVTATVRADVTDGTRVGRFVQVRRMVLADDGRWLHAALRPPRRAQGDMARFSARRLRALFPAADASLLRPALTGAAMALDAFCTDTARCDDDVRLSFDGVVAVARGAQLAAPSRHWLPDDAVAGELLAFSIARQAALEVAPALRSRLDELGRERPDDAASAVLTAVVEVRLMQALDAAVVGDWARDDTAATLGLSLWHLGPEGLHPDAFDRADRAAAARAFAAAMAADGPQRLAGLYGAWTRSGAHLWLESWLLDEALGPGGFAAVVNWPVPQPPSPLPMAIIVGCGRERLRIAGDDVAYRPRLDALPLSTPFAEEAEPAPFAGVPSPDGARIARLVDTSVEVAYPEGVDRPPWSHAVVVTAADGGADQATLPLTPERLASAFAPGLARDDWGYLRPTALRWSDDGAWLAVSIPAAWRCGDRIDCRLVVAWHVASDRLRGVVNSPMTDHGDPSWSWDARWLPGTHRLALRVDGDGGDGTTPVLGEPPRQPRAIPLGWRQGARGAARDSDPTIAFVLDADSGDVEAVPRSESRRIAAVMPNVSPDGRWHLRRDEMWRLVAEPIDAVGGYRDGDPATGWRFNRPFCGPFAAWGNVDR